MQQMSKSMCSLIQLFNISHSKNSCVLFCKFRSVDDFRQSCYYSWGVEIVIKRFAFTQELGEEKQVELSDTLSCIFYIETAAISDRNGWFYDHHGIGIDAKNKIYYIFYAMGVEEILYRVVICRSSDNNEICVTICRSTIKSRCQIQILFGKIFLYIIVLNGR